MRVEFYKEGVQQPFCGVAAGFQPEEGDLVSIKGETWKVVGRSFSVDYAGTANAEMRCNVIVRSPPTPAQRENS